jgi:hypothetical protein
VSAHLQLKGQRFFVHGLEQPRPTKLAMHLDRGIEDGSACDIFNKFCHAELIPRIRESTFAAVQFRTFAPLRQSR